MTEKLISAIVDMQEESALKTTTDLLEAGTSPLEILDACRQAMDIIGSKFESGQAFIPELMLAGEMMTSITGVIKPLMKGDSSQKKAGKVVIGTVAGDIHDIAKDIVAFMLDINGFEVTDLGVDVSVEKFVDTVKETGASIVGLSGFLTLAYEPMKETVEALKAAGLDVKTMIGGGQIDEQVREYTGATAYGSDAMAAVSLAKEWQGEN